MANKGIKYVQKYKLDQKDKQIIKTLFENGRYSIADIAKKTRIRRDSVMYRIKKLQENYVITGFQPIINGPAIGFPNTATILLKTKLKTQKEKQDFIEKIKAISPILHIALTIGKYDYQLAILHRDTEHLYKIIEGIKTAVPGYVLEYEVLQIVDEPKFEDVENLVMNEV